MKKVLSLCLIVIMALTAIGGTLAYFTDKEVETNVFTVGDVNIEIRERKDADENWTSNDDYHEFLEDTIAMPGVEIPKYVTIANIGKNDAYVRVTIDVPADMTAIYADPVEGWTLTVDGAPATNANDTKLKDLEGPAKLIWTSKTPMDADSNDESPKLLYKMKLNDDLNSLKAGESYNVVVTAEAIQADGFDSAEEAFNALDTELESVKTVSTNNTKDMNEALENAGTVVQFTDDVVASEYLAMNGTNTTVDGNGKTYNVTNPATTDKNAGIYAPNGGTIKNITITGEDLKDAGFRGIFTNEGLKDNLVVEKVNVTGTYAINVTGSNEHKLVVKDSTLNGWVSYATASAEFTNTKFVTKDNYNVLRPYCDTTLTGCNFTENYRLCNGKDVASLVITMDNTCSVGDTLITAENVGTLLNLDEFTGTIIVNGTSVKFVATTPAAE